ncbi:tellurite resistance protein [Clostridium tetani 12124569]|nr:tellurite resistance protein [Clostridium tetani 12124569]
MVNNEINTINDVPDFNLEKTTNEVKLKLQNSPEILSLSKEIDLKNVDTIMNFGQSASQEISTFADKILHSIETTSVEDSGELLTQLNKIMNKFDVQDFKDKKPGFFEKLFKKTKDSIDALLKKYHTMGGEVDKVYIQLKNMKKK